MPDDPEVRLKVSGELHQFLSAYAMAHDRDMASVVRRVLEEWADKERHAHTLLTRMLRGKGSETE